MLEPQIPPVTPPIPRLRGRHLRHQSAQNWIYI
jgi:hypothetical protein